MVCPMMQSPFRKGALILVDMYVECFSAIDSKYSDDVAML